MAKMTHVEFFTYPVWEKDLEWLSRVLVQKETIFNNTVEDEKMVSIKGVQPVLFDYRSKDPITKSCRMVILPTSI